MVYWYIGINFIILLVITYQLDPYWLLPIIIPYSLCFLELNDGIDIFLFLVILYSY